MISVNFSHELDKAKAEVESRHREQIPYATMLALNRTADAARVAVRQEMARVFDRPTPFTLASTRTKYATKAKLVAEVALKDEGNKGGGNAAVRIEPQLVGGPRRYKRMEGALRRAGLLGNSEMALPGQAAELDAYGNMSRGQIVQILAWFQAFPETGTRQNMTREKKSKMAAGRVGKRYAVRYYYKRDGKGRGIYKATQTGFGSAIQPVLMFVRPATYKRRLDMPGAVRRTVQREFVQWFRDALKDAIRTAR